MSLDDGIDLDIDVVDLTREGLRSLQSADPTGASGWYRKARLEALAAVGLVAAYNPLQPRGRDGRWIEVFGWVRWLENGKWRKGRVTEVSSTDGRISIKDVRTGADVSFTRQEARRRLFTVAKPKATLSLPNPKGESVAGFTKIGGQGGSNPGGLYQVTDPVAVAQVSAVRREHILDAVRAARIDGKKFNTTYSSIDEETPDATALALVPNGAILLDERDGKYYTKSQGQLLDDQGLAVPVFDVIGAPNSDQRKSSIGKLQVVESSDQGAIDDVLTSARSMTAGEPGQDEKFYVKAAKSPEHARNEALANFLYELGGVPIPDVAVGEDGQTIASKIVEAKVETLSLSDGIKDPEILSTIREDLVFDAWLANWDVTGLTLDNIIIVDGVPHRIDAGGALLYRAQGAPKGKFFGDEVGELESLTNGVNPQAAKVFGKVTPAELKAGAERLAAISPAEIVRAVDEHGLDKSLSDRLVARRKFILDKYDVPEPGESIDSIEKATDVDLDSAEVLADQPKLTPESLAEMHWSVLDGKYVPGASDQKPVPMKAWLDNRTTMLSISQIEAEFSAGKSAFIADPTSPTTMYLVESISPPGVWSVTMDVVHPHLGKKRLSFVPSDFVTAAVADETDEFELPYMEKWSQFADQVVSAHSTVSAVDLAPFSSVMPTYTTMKAADVKPGWAIKGGKAYRVFGAAPVHPDGSIEVTAENWDGESTFFDLAYDVKFGDDKSLFANALEAAWQKDQVLKEADSKSDALGPTKTKTDDKMASAMAVQTSVSEKAAPAVESSPITNAPQPTPADFQDPDTGVNVKLDVIGEKKKVSELVQSEGQNLISRAFVITQDQTAINDGGVFTVTKILSDSVQGVDQTGRPTNIPAHRIMQEVTPPGGAITSMQLKKDQTIVVNGVVVGKWQKKPFSSWVHTVIDAEYSVSGRKYERQSYTKSYVRGDLIPMIVAPGVTGSKAKSQKALDVESAVVTSSLKAKPASIEFGAPGGVSESGTALSLLDGSEVKKGLWTISKTDGKVGQIEVIESGTGYVKVRMEDGSLKGRAASTLSAARDPKSGATPFSPLYANVKLGDGTQPYPSQRVTDGGASAQIVMVKEDGSVRISKDGKFFWTKASKLTPADGTEVGPGTSAKLPPVAEAPGAVVAAQTEAWKIVKKPKKIPYTAPGDVTISQPSHFLETYRKFAPTRKLTRDQFVPMLGMHVRDDDGNQHVIVKVARTYDTNPSTVWTRPVGVTDGWYKPKAMQPSRLWVDHAAELATSDGKPLPKLSGLSYSDESHEFTPPTGSVMYSYPSSAYVSDRAKSVDAYLIATPNGDLLRISSDGISSSGAKSHLPFNLTRIGYFDETSTTVATVDIGSSASKYGGSSKYVNGLWIHNDEPGALEKLKQEAHQNKIDLGIVEAEKFEGSYEHLVNLPKPSTVVDVSADTALPKIPGTRADGSVLEQAPAVQSSHSVKSGVEKLTEQITAGGAGSRSVYAMSDSDHIEDMAVRLQSVADVDGNEYVEVRFRLLEDKIDTLSDQLVIGEGSKIGGWKQSTQVTASSLVIGDTVRVKIGYGGVLKIDSGYGKQIPNATVAGSPKKIGATEKGLDAYEVPVALSSGVIVNMIVEERAAPSIWTHEWDPTMPLASSNFVAQINPSAAAAGWKIRNSGGTSYEARGGKTMIDDKGRKIFDPTGTELMSVKSGNGAQRLTFDDGDGGSISVQTTHTASSERQSHVTSGSTRRSSVNGEVLIRVRADDPNLTTKVSAMMSAVGIPVESQGQPEPKSLRRMALNKVYRQLSPTYAHLQRPNVTGDGGDQGEAQVLKLIDDRFGTALGRKATIDDIMIRTNPDGRVQVVFSDDVADAIVKTSSFKSAYHGVTGSGAVEIFTSKVGTGLMSTDERWSQGILTGGLSSDRDASYDSGNRVYMRLSTDNSLTGTNRIYISAKETAKQVDSYFNNADHFGRRSQSNGQQYTTSSFAGNNEIMLKRKIELGSIGYFLVGSESARQSRIAEIKAAGVTHIGGRPIEDVIIVSGTKTPTDLDALPPGDFVEIPLGGLV